jgi:5-hydroxyisourate hydrolase-like protein (transthyretin family)
VVSRIAGTTWLDLNGNGHRDQGDRPFSGVTVVLAEEGGQVIATVTTDADGRYSFENLPAGVYRLSLRPPAGYRALSREIWVLHLKCAAVEMDFGYQPEEQG